MKYYDAINTSYIRRRSTAMMKIWFYFWALSSAILVFGEARRTTPTPNLEGKPLNTTEIIQNIYVDTIREFGKRLREWASYDISVADITSYILPTTQSSAGDYSVNITDMIARTGYGSSYEDTKREITCLFGDNLRVQMPIPNFEFTGSMIISSNQFSPLTYKFSINFKEMNYTFSTEPDFNIGDGLPNNQSEVDITYQQIKVDVEIPDNDEYSAVQEVDRLLKQIKSSLKTMVHEQLTIIIQQKVSYLSLFTSCIRFRQEIAQKNRISFSNENRYAYFINDATANWLNGVALKIDSVEITGLLNFDSLTVSSGSGFSGEKFTLRITNLEGRTSWYYYVDENRRNSAQFNFTIDSMLIYGDLYRSQSYCNNIDIKFEESFNNGAENDDTWVSFSKEIVFDRLKTILRSSLKESLGSVFRNIAHRWG